MTMHDLFCHSRNRINIFISNKAVNQNLPRKVHCDKTTHFSDLPPPLSTMPISYQQVHVHETGEDAVGFTHEEQHVLHFPACSKKHRSKGFRESELCWLAWTGFLAPSSKLKLPIYQGKKNESFVSALSTLSSGWMFPVSHFHTSAFFTMMTTDSPSTPKCRAQMHWSIVFNSCEVQPIFPSQGKYLQGYAITPYSSPQLSLLRLATNNCSQQHRSQHRLQNPHRKLGRYSKVSHTRISLRVYTISTTLSLSPAPLCARKQQALYCGYGHGSWFTRNKPTHKVLILAYKWE